MQSTPPPLPSHDRFELASQTIPRSRIVKVDLLHFGNARPGRPERQRAQARRSSTPASTRPHRDLSRLNATPQDPLVSISFPLLFLILITPNHSGSNTTQARPNPLSPPLGGSIPFSPLSLTPLFIASTPLPF
jgi:hypothetical protein